MTTLQEDMDQLAQLLPQLRKNKFRAIYYGGEKRKFHRITFLPTPDGMMLAINNIDFAGRPYGGTYFADPDKIEDPKILDAVFPFWRYAHRDISERTDNPVILQIWMEHQARLGSLTYFGE